MPLLPVQLVQPPTGDLLPAGPHVCGPNGRIAVCARLCPHVCSIALFAFALCGSGMCAAVCPDGVDGDAAILRPTLHDVRIGRPDVLPPSGFVLHTGIGLLCRAELRLCRFGLQRLRRRRLGRLRPDDGVRRRWHGRWRRLQLLRRRRWLGRRDRPGPGHRVT